MVHLVEKSKNSLDVYLQIVPESPGCRDLRVVTSHSLADQRGTMQLVHAQASWFMPKVRR